LKTLFISESSAASLAAIAVTAKVFSGIILDCPTLYNSKWIAALLGGIFILPAAFATDQIRQKCPTSPFNETKPGYRTALSVLWAITFAFDAALTVVSIGASASYIAVGNVTTFYLLLPQFTLCIWCLFFNGDAIGNAARLFGHFLLIVIAITAIIALPKYRPNWLTPLLGPGAPTLAVGSLRCAGWYSILIPVFLLARNGSDHRAGHYPAVRSLCAASVLTAILLLLNSMLSPALLTGDEATRFSRMDSLLSNGRLPLGMQLPMIVLWLISLFFLMLFDAWFCAVMVQMASPRLKKTTHILIATALIVALSFSGLTNRNGNRLSGLLYLPINLLLLIPFVWHSSRIKGGSPHA